MKIHDATRKYEAWLAGHVRVVKDDLKAKHELMAQDGFSFLRATFYRWIQLFPELCPKLVHAPAVLGVGDLHVENYGTWRDAEGRLVWGINDFDEAFPLPYTADLARLASSAWLAITLGHLSIVPIKACAAILEGYTQALEKGGEAFVLSEKHPLLREAVTSRLRDPVRFWDKLAALPTLRDAPTKVTMMLRQAMPDRRIPFKVAHRRAGLGSLGRERFTAIAEWCGGKVAREAKALLPSACVWARGVSDRGPERRLQPSGGSELAKPSTPPSKSLAGRTIYYSQIVTRAVRAPDPFLAVEGTWVLRRLSPYCSRIELSQMPRSHDTEKLMRAMGWELANVHLGSPRAVAGVRRDLQQRKSKWLPEAAEIMLAATIKDWKEWKKGPH